MDCKKYKSNLNINFETNGLATYILFTFRACDEDYEQK